MEPYEKEEIFCEEIQRVIERFCSEYQMTYAQVLGCLQMIGIELIDEGNSPQGEFDVPE